MDESQSAEDVSSTAKAAQNVDKALGSPLSLLLGPSFKLVGAHLGKKTEAWLNSKQQENVVRKVSTLQAGGSLDFGEEPTPRQIGALIEWTHAAKDVDDRTQATLAGAWVKALRDIAGQNYVLLDALHSFNEQELAVFLSGGELSADQVDDFAKIGLLEVVHETPSLRFTMKNVASLLIVNTLIGMLAWRGFNFKWIFDGTEGVVRLGYWEMSKITFSFASASPEGTVAMRTDISLLPLGVIVFILSGLLLVSGKWLYAYFKKPTKVVKILPLGQNLLDRLEVTPQPHYEIER